MKLGSTRSLEGLRTVLKDPNTLGPDPVYLVISEVSKSEWANITIITAGNFGGEYPKTFGHYHGSSVNETYHLIEGKGVLQMQKKCMENGVWVKDKVEAVYLIQAKPGDEIVITPEWGHSWSNVGKGPLISFDDWRAGHSPTDYQEIERLGGMAYYLIEEDGQPKAVPNPKYQDLPKPIWISPAEFKQKFL